MYWEICYDKFEGNIIPSPYYSGWQMSREPFSVSCMETHSSYWVSNRWVFRRLNWCEENNIKLVGLDEQDYIISEDGEEYKPIKGKYIRTLEFRFKRREDAILFKMVWG